MISFFIKEGRRLLHKTAKPSHLLTKLKNKTKETNIEELLTTLAWPSLGLDASFCKTSMDGRQNTLLKHVLSSSTLSSISKRGLSILRSREKKCNQCFQEYQLRRL